MKYMKRRYSGKPFCKSNRIQNCHYSYFFDYSIVFFAKQLYFLIKHYTIQQYSRWNASNHTLNEEKTKSILMPSQDIALLLYLMIFKQKHYICTINTYTTQYNWGVQFTEAAVPIFTENHTCWYFFNRLQA